MDALIERFRDIDPAAATALGMALGVIVAYIARWWWTAPVVRAVARLEDAVRRRA